ncbi:hypothetical protein PEC302110_37530 [Pectobacterium araliae]|uniref:Uncharacterized protein n=1 Tax=Pectobacterium araliae TaxID=3073862 RepID=A0AAN0MMZ3_9GAMM|nr:hypothetical protein PEC302110_37530 [Pectobacterium sp. MAFF 302110]
MHFIEPKAVYSHIPALTLNIIITPSGSRQAIFPLRLTGTCYVYRTLVYKNLVGKDRVIYSIQIWSP